MIGFIMFGLAKMIHYFKCNIYYLEWQAPAEWLHVLLQSSQI